jgi:hypothetical protein
MPGAAVATWGGLNLANTGKTGTSPEKSARDRKWIEKKKSRTVGLLFRSCYNLKHIQGYLVGQE